MLIEPYNYKKAVNDLLDNTSITQAELGKYIWVTQGRVSQISNGIDSNTVRYETLHQLKELCTEHGIETTTDKEEITEC